MRRSLRTRLTIWFAASVVLILAPFLAGVLALEWRSMRAALEHHLREDAEIAAEMLVVTDGAFHWRMEDPEDPGYDAGPQRWVEVYTGDGRLVFVRGLPRRRAIADALPRPTAATVGYRTIRTPAGASVRLFSTTESVGGTPVVLRVARSEDDLRADLRWLGLVFAIATPLAVLAASIAGYIVSGRALLPLARMAAQAHSIGADDLSQRLPVENPSDEMGQLALVFNDTFSRLQQSFERLKRFTADASHQLRTPLTAIRSVGEVGLREAHTKADYDEVVGSMLEEVDGLSRIVERLLVLSRWESGRVPIIPVPLDLREVLTSVAAQLSVLAEERSISIEVAATETLRTLADVDMMRAAVTNLVDNAIKFAPDGGRVRLSGSLHEGRCRIAFEDSGPGIPADERSRVLERFHRIDTGLDNGAVPHGTGLGLAIADWVVRAHGGVLRVEESPLGGARLLIDMPCVPFPHEI